MATSEPVTISRVAFFGGLTLGIAIVGTGFYVVPLLSLPDWAGAMLELFTVGAAMGTTTAIWRRSSKAGVDSSSGDRDGEGNVRTPGP